MIPDPTDRPDPPDQKHIPRSVLFRRAACNFARLMEQIEDGEYPVYDPAMRRMFRDARDHLNLLIRGGERAYNTACNGWRSAKMDAATRAVSRQAEIEDATI